MHLERVRVEVQGIAFRTAMASCDAQELGHVDGAALKSPRVGETRRAPQTIPPAIRRAVMRRDHGRCVVPGCKNHRFVDVLSIVGPSDAAVVLQAALRAT